MGIMSRAVRLCKADLHDVMDQMEDKNALLRQHLREMQAALADRQARIDGLEESLRVAQRDRSTAEKELQTREEEIDRAVARGRDDIARMLIGKFFPLRQSVEQIARRLEETAHRLEKERERLGTQRLAYDEIRQRVATARERTHRAGPMPDPRLAPAEPSWRPSEEEIEWELLQRKEALGSGTST